MHMQNGRYLARISVVYRFYKSVSYLTQESLQNSWEGKEEARDRDRDVEARQDFWSIVGNYTCIYRVHVATRTKRVCSKGRFPDTSEITLMSRDEWKQAFMFFKRRPIDDYWNVHGDKSLSEPWIGLPRLELLNKKSPEEYIGVRGRRRNKSQQDPDIFCQKNDQTCQKVLSVKPKKMVARKTKSGRCERTTKHLLYSGRWPWLWRNHENCQKKIEDRKSPYSASCITHTSCWFRSALWSHQSGSNDIRQHNTAIGRHSYNTCQRIFRHSGWSEAKASSLLKTAGKIRQKRLQAWKTVLKELTRRRQEPWASDNWMLQEHQASGGWLRQKICQVVRKLIFARILMENSTSRSLAIPQRVSSRRATKSTNFTIECWTVCVPDLVNILPISRISSSTLGSGANSRATAYWLHLGLQRITMTSKGWRRIKFFQAHKIWESVQRQVKILIGRKDAYNMQTLPDWNRFRWSRITLHGDPAAKLIRMKARESDPANHWATKQEDAWNENGFFEKCIWQPEKCNAFGTYYQVLLPFRSRSIFRITWMGKIQSISMKGSYFMSMFNDIEWRKKGNTEKCLHNATEVAAFATKFKPRHWCFLEPASESAWCNANSKEPQG